MVARLLVALLLLYVPLSAVQVAVPASDNTDGAWIECSGDGDGDHFDELAVDDDTTTDWNSDSAGAALISNLGSLTDPVSSSGHVVTISGRKVNGSNCNSGENSGEDVSFTITLRQNTTSIASTTTAALGSSFTEYTLTLSGAEADSITDYGDLNVQVACNDDGGGAPRDCVLSYIELEVPDAPAGGGRRRSLIGITGGMAAAARVPPAVIDDRRAWLGRAA